MNYYYFIPDGCDTTIKKIATTKSRLSLGDVYHIIDCDLVENVSVKVTGKFATMIVDEEGLLTSKKVNAIASCIMDYYIIGDVIITKTSAWKTFTEEQANNFDEALRKFAKHYNIINMKITEDTTNED